VATFSPECGGKGICRERISRFHYDCEVRGAKGVDLSQYGFKEMAPALCSIDDSSASARSSTALAAVDPSMIPGDFYRNAWDLCKSSSFKGSCAERKVQGGTVYDIRVPQNTTLIRFGRDSALGVGKETQFPLIYKSGSVIWADGSNFGIVDGRFHEDDFFVVDNKAPIPRRDPRRSAGVQAAAYLCQGKRACDFARVPVGMTLIHGEAGVPVREGSTIPGCSEEASGSVSSRCFTVLLRSVLVENSEIY
jgi:hypothetical protein